MANIKVKGIVIRQTNFDDNDKIFTILSAEFGLIQAIAKGVRLRKSAINCCRMFVYAEFVLFQGKKMYNINSLDIISDFFDVSKSLETLALACYLAELCERVSTEIAPDERLLPLLLNSLFLLKKGDQSISIIKSVYELKLLVILGFMPRLDGCKNCGDELTYIDIGEGIGYCKNCAAVNENLIFVASATLMAMRYIVFSDIKKAFSFSIAMQNLIELNDISEKYVRYHLSNTLKTLEYYHSIL